MFRLSDKCGLLLYRQVIDSGTTALSQPSSALVIAGGPQILVIDGMLEQPVPAIKAPVLPRKNGGRFIIVGSTNQRINQEPGRALSAAS